MLKPIPLSLISQFETNNSISILLPQVLSLFIILVMLWLFRAPEFIAGWASFFSNAFPLGDDAKPM